ncbi:hypothetical protein [Dyadobacter tibetensis]|uniref:hypothetical protein n=1 Tax=Dyadobacter tibetensis TaxID=1211851 RepID=UPI00103E54D0|nr:hypothetical protein [Dyadobacter tibetensis]
MIAWTGLPLQDITITLEQAVSILWIITENLKFSSRARPRARGIVTSITRKGMEKGVSRPWSVSSQTINIKQFTHRSVYC